MRYAWIGFHIIMLLMIIAAFSGAFSPPATGQSMMQDSGRTIMPVFGVVTIWIVGAIIFRFARRFSRYDS